MQLLQRYGMLFLILSIFGCFQKKKQPENLKSWLDTNFPDQLVVDHNIVNLDLKNLYYKKKETIVADKNDPEVQIKITWHKNEGGLDLNKEEIQKAWDNSKRDVAAARTLYAALKENGLQKFSVGVIDMAAYILIFGEPTPPVRKKYLEHILPILDKRQDTTQTSIWIECIEDSMYQKDFNEIIPNGYWHRGGTLHEDQKLMSLDFKWSEDLTPEALNSGWAFNSNSARSFVYVEDAYVTASAWAEKNLSSPFYLEPVQMVQLGPDENDLLSFLIDFPYFRSKPDSTETVERPEPIGYVSGSYHTDQKTFSKIKHITEQ